LVVSGRTVSVTSVRTIELTPYIGYDFGIIEYDADIWKHMVGSGFGFKAKYGGLDFSFNVSIPLYAYDGVAEEHYTTSFNIVYQF
jgi:hemolysin activation/secretion protein